MDSLYIGIDLHKEVLGYRGQYRDRDVSGTTYWGHNVLGTVTVFCLFVCHNNSLLLRPTW